jgi:hypothetical protein
MEAVRQPAAAVHLQLVSRLFLELAHLLDRVPGEHRGVLPFRSGQGRGPDILWLPVELGRHEVVGIGDPRPAVVHHRVGGSAEKNRVRLANHELTITPKSSSTNGTSQPPSGEAAGDVFVGAAGALHDPVDGEKRVHGKPHGDLRPVT